PGQKILRLKGELRFVQRILLELALPRFLRQGLEAHQLLRNLTLTRTFGGRPILFRQRLDKLLEFADGHLFIADREDDFVESLSGRGGCGCHRGCLRRDRSRRFGGGSRFLWRDCGRRFNRGRCIWFRLGSLRGQSSSERQEYCKGKY